MTSISTNEYSYAARNLDLILNENCYEDEKGAFNTVQAETVILVPTKEETISDLKKQIKHCKNHMERKKLEQKLNALYKKRRVK